MTRSISHSAFRNAICATHCNWHMCIWEFLKSHDTVISHSAFRNAICATHCNTLQHTATHCNTLQHTATVHSGMRYLQHTATGICAHMYAQCIQECAKHRFENFYQVNIYVYIHMYIYIYIYIYINIWSCGTTTVYTDYDLTCKKFWLLRNSVYIVYISLYMYKYMYMYMYMYMYYVYVWGCGTTAVYTDYDLTSKEKFWLARNSVYIDILWLDLREIMYLRNSVL